MKMNEMKKKEIKTYINLFNSLGVLKEIDRTGWILAGIRKPESIADHNFRVTIMATVLCDTMKLGLDKTKVLEMSLVHDWGTVKVGDIISEHGKQPVGDKKAKRVDERNVTKELIKDLGKRGERYLDLWDEYNKQKTPEATFLKQVEKLEMVLQALGYEQTGHPAKDLDEFWENAEKYLEGKELEPIFRELQGMRKKK